MCQDESPRDETSPPPHSHSTQPPTSHSNTPNSNNNNNNNNNANNAYIHLRNLNQLKTECEYNAVRTYLVTSLRVLFSATGVQRATGTSNRSLYYLDSRTLSGKLFRRKPFVWIISADRIRCSNIIKFSSTDCIKFCRVRRINEHYRVSTCILYARGEQLEYDI